MPGVQIWDWLSDGGSPLSRLPRACFLRMVECKGRQSDSERSLRSVAVRLPCPVLGCMEGTPKVRWPAKTRLYIMHDYATRYPV